MMIQWLVLVFLAVAAWFDYRTMRIPNRLQKIAIIAVWSVIFLFYKDTIQERLLTTLGLCLFLFVFVLIRQSGAGDLKMVMWFGALGMNAFGVLFTACVIMVVYWVIRLIRKQKTAFVPLAPFLFIGCLLWKLTVIS
jgi:Flp pilus assembly protein protease CpaA